MMPIWHIIFGALFSLIPYIFLETSLKVFLVMFFSSWLFIDLDLVFVFILNKRSLNPLEFWMWGKTKRKRWLALSSKEKRFYKYPIRVFHTVEFLVILGLLALISDIFLAVLYGFFVHLFLDWIDLHSRKEEKYSKISLISTIIKNKNKKEFV